MPASNIDCNLEPTEIFHGGLGVRPATQSLEPYSCDDDDNDENGGFI